MRSKRKNYPLLFPELNVLYSRLLVRVTSYIYTTTTCQTCSLSTLMQSPANLLQHRHYNRQTIRMCEITTTTKNSFYNGYCLDLKMVIPKIAIRLFTSQHYIIEICVQAYVIERMCAHNTHSSTFPKMLKQVFR